MGVQFNNWKVVVACVWSSLIGIEQRQKRQIGGLERTLNLKMENGFMAMVMNEIGGLVGWGYLMHMRTYGPKMPR